jgi:hypothetical protein
MLFFQVLGIEPDTMTISSPPGHESAKSDARTAAL